MAVFHRLKRSKVHVNAGVEQHTWSTLSHRTPFVRILLTVFPYCLLIPVTSFANNHLITAAKRQNSLQKQLQLVPISEIDDASAGEIILGDFNAKVSEATQNGYVLGNVEESDFVELSRLIIESFGTEVVQIGSDANEFERMMMAPAVELLNGSSGLVAFAEVMAGLRSRLQRRQATNLSPPNLYGLTAIKQNEIVAKSSLILAVSYKQSLVATVELRLQPSDAKIPFSFPVIDAIERKIAAILGEESNNTIADADFQPYLSNLCVLENHRGRGLGRALVTVVETIARDMWGFDKLYLHVDPANKAAMGLYRSEGYVDVGRRWRPFWAGTSSSIGYFVKKI